MHAQSVLSEHARRGMFGQRSGKVATVFWLPASVQVLPCRRFPFRCERVDHGMPCLFDDMAAKDTLDAIYGGIQTYLGADPTVHIL